MIVEAIEIVEREKRSSPPALYHVLCFLIIIIIPKFRFSNGTTDAVETLLH